MPSKAIFTIRVSSRHHLVDARRAAVAPGGGSDDAEAEAEVEGLVFVLSGDMRLTVDGESYQFDPGRYAYLPPGRRWGARCAGSDGLSFLWLRKVYEPLPGADPALIVGHEGDAPVSAMPGTSDFWSTPLIPTDDIAYDMHVNIVSYVPGAGIPFAETHIMEHVDPCSVQGDEPHGLRRRRTHAAQRGIWTALSGAKVVPRSKGLTDARLGMRQVLSRDYSCRDGDRRAPGTPEADSRQRSRRRRLGRRPGETVVGGHP